VTAIRRALDLVPMMAARQRVRKEGRTLPFRGERGKVGKRRNFVARAVLARSAVRPLRFIGLTFDKMELAGSTNRGCPLPEFRPALTPSTSASAARATVSHLRLDQRLCYLSPKYVRSSSHRGIA
jgi:hypothetical protein